MTFSPVVLLSQRVIRIDHRSETGDYLNLRWIEMVDELGGLPYAAPNHSRRAMAMYDEIRPDLLVLTGGNDLSPEFWGPGTYADTEDSVSEIAVERDRTESTLVSLAERDRIPVLAICRGAQLLAVRSGAFLRRDSRHAGTRHAVHRLPKTNVRRPSRAWDGWEAEFNVDSHHRWTLPRLPEFPSALRPLLVADDGTVEAFTDATGRQLALMWHPEREGKQAPSAPGRLAVRELFSRLHKTGRLFDSQL